VRVEDKYDKVDAKVELQLLRHEVSLSHLLGDQLLPRLDEVVLVAPVERLRQSVQQGLCLRVRQSRLPLLVIVLELLLK
jgi:hypothetical protein